MLNKMKSALGRKTIIVIFLMALTIECSSQIIEDGTYVQQVWSRGYNGSDDRRDRIQSMIVDAEGNIYVTGNSTETGRSEDCTTIKYNSAGVRQWIKKYDANNSYDGGLSAAVDASGNIYVTGFSEDNTVDYITIKYSAAGVEQWVKKYNGTGNSDDYAHSIAVDEDGYVYVTGNSRNASGNNDFVTIKYTSYGNAVWVKRYDGPENLNDWASSVAVDSSGNVYVAGHIKRSETDFDYVIIKYNSSGTEQWVRTYDGPGHKRDYVSKMVLGYNNTIFLTGYSEGDGVGYDYATIRYNTSGYMQWAKRYNGPANGQDYATSLVVDDAGNTYVTGYSAGNGTSLDYATIKYNLAGTMQWLKRYDGVIHENDFAEDIAIDASGNVYITGRVSTGYLDYEMTTIKYNSSGNQKWIKAYDNPGGKTSDGSFVAVYGSEIVYVAGISDISGSGYGNEEDYKIVKYSQSPYTIQNRIEMPNTFSLSQNYPNPFNPVTKISFSIPANSYTRLTVYDIYGKQVAELVNSELEAGTYNIDFDAGNLGSGVYFYKIETGKFSETRKMMLVK